MTPEELAILKTVVYADMFHYPLRLGELSDGLFDISLTPDELRSWLDHSAVLEAALEERDGFVFLRGHGGIVSERFEAEERTREALNRHAPALVLVSKLPYVRLLALSGAAAFENMHDDDVDVFIIAARRRAWSVCLLVTIVTRLLNMRRTVCANYILDEDSLAIAEHDFYTSHQLTHLRPLVGGEMYKRFIDANSWAEPHSPGAYRVARARTAPPSEIGLSERILAFGPGSLFEAMSRRVLDANLRRKVPRGPDTGAVRLERGRLKLHTNDHRPPTLRRFERALAETVAAAERSISATNAAVPRARLGAIS